jgi:hypothetical protein
MLKVSVPVEPWRFHAAADLMPKITILVAAAHLVLCPTAVAQVPPASSCIEQLERPTYPRMARIANIQGTLKVRFTIGLDGVPTDVVIDGHPILAQELTSAVHRTRLTPNCAGRLDLSYRFALEGPLKDEAPTSVTFTSSTEVLVTSQPTGIICALETEPQKSRLRRLLTKLLH